VSLKLCSNDRPLALEKYLYFTLPLTSACEMCPRWTKILLRRSPPDSLVSEHRRILVVDDEPQITRVLRTTLSSQGYDIRAANDGDTALHSYRTMGRIPLRAGELIFFAIESLPILIWPPTRQTQSPDPVRHHNLLMNPLCSFYANFMPVRVQ
jgi:hypothetical protein